MTTKAEMIKQLKSEYPTLKSGDDERGYKDLSAADYEATISQWADSLVADNAKAEAEAKAAADKAALLVKLGITADEAKLLLS
jgi:hypothetical protein